MCFNSRWLAANMDTFAFVTLVHRSSRRATRCAYLGYGSRAAHRKQRSRAPPSARRPRSTSMGGSLRGGRYLKSLILLAWRSQTTHTFITWYLLIMTLYNQSYVESRHAIPQWLKWINEVCCCWPLNVTRYSVRSPQPCEQKAEQTSMHWQHIHTNKWSF